MRILVVLAIIWTLINPSATPSLVHVWPGGIVPYEIDESLSKRSRRDLRRAMNTWSSATGVIFLKKPNNFNRVVFRDSDVCSSAIGMFGGQQAVNLHTGCGYEATLHELGHVLGLIHEHQRYDRDRWVLINPKCFESFHPGIVSNFFKLPFGIVPSFGPYDYNSIMHYSENAFGECRTIIKKKKIPKVRKFRKLSPMDIKKVRFMYYWEFKKR